MLFPLDDQPRNQEFKDQAFKNQVSSTNFNSLNSLITLQVQEFKLQAQELKFQVQAFQVSSSRFKFKTEKRFYITLTLKEAKGPKVFHNPNPTWKKTFIMVLTQLQTTAFFENPDQLGIPHETMVQIQREGIQAVADLADFEKQELQQLADNLRKPGGRIPDPNPNAAPGATIPTPAFTFGAKSQKRLTVACDLVRYYQTVGRDLTSANIQWNQVMSNFEIQWKALKEKKDEDDPDVPTITKALPIIKWTEAFQDFLHRVIGARMIPLAYVIRTNPQVPGTAPTLAPNQPHSTEHGSVEDELIARASHTHALFRDDNSVVYYHLEKATRGTSYAASIKPFTRAKDGRGAWKALTSQYAGKDKWEAEIKRQEQLLHTRIWKGQSNFSLENFISQHRNAYVSMQASAEHVQYQLPNEHSRVRFLL